MIPFNIVELEEIKNLISQKNINDEIEFKIQTPTYENKYVSSIPELYYNNLLSYLDETKEDKHSETSKITDYSGRDGQFRIIRNEQDKVIYNYKKREEVKDFNFYFINIRLTRSIDMEIKKSEFDLESKYFKPNPFERLRKRYIYKLSNGIEIHLTSINDKKSFECEFEINGLISKNLESKKLVEIIHSTLNHFLNIMLNVEYLPRNNEVSSLEYQYNRLIDNRSNYEFRTKLINIKLSDVKYMEHYNVSNKLDGVQYYLIFGVNTLYFINPSKISRTNIKSLIVYRINIPRDLLNTVIDGELVEVEKALQSKEINTKTYNAFDTIVYKGRNLTKFKFSERLNHVKLILNELKFSSANLKLLYKPFFSGNNLYVLTLLTIKYINDKYNGNIDKIIEDNDGLVFIPENEPYINSGSKKWKFYKRITMDFGLKLQTETKETKTFKLYGMDYKTETFFYNTRTKSDAILTVNNTLVELKNNVIVEVKYDLNTNKFIFMRIRPDKVFPNSIKAIESIWKDIINPIYLNTLLMEMKKYHSLEKSQINEQEILKIVYMWDGIDTKRGEEKRGEEKRGEEKRGKEKRGKEKRGNWRIFNNKIKRMLIESVISETNKKLVDVIDIGGGKLGDIDKYWKINKINRLYIIEPNKEFLEEGKRRIEQLIADPRIKLNPQAKTNTILINQSLQKFATSEKDKSQIPNKVLFISTFFSLTFLFGSEQDVDLLVNFISSMLLPGGYFFGTVVDGDYLRKTLDEEKGKIIVKSGGSITRLYNPDKLKDYGDKIEIELDTATVSKQIEYLVYFDMLIEKLKNVNVDLIQTKMFYTNKDFKLLSEDEKLLPSLSREFIFMKREEISRKLESLSDDEIKTFDNNEDADIQLVRVATLGENHCFYHAYMNSVSEEYRDSSDEEKRKMTAKKRKEMVNLLELKDYENLKGAVINDFEIELTKHIDEIFDDLEEKDFVNIVDTVNKTKPDTLILYKNEFKKQFKILGYEEKSINEIFDKIIQKNFTKFKTLIGECQITLKAIPYLMEKLKINIIMFQDINRKFYKLGVPYNDNNLYIIMLNLNNFHYESCGILYADKDNNAVIDYVLYPNEKLVVMAKNFNI
jgi:hypothetical protein